MAVNKRGTNVDATNGSTWASTSGFRFRTVLVQVARQNGKSTLAQVLSLWRMFVDRSPLVIGTAQNLDVAEEVWTGAVEMAEGTAILAALLTALDGLGLISDDTTAE